MKATNGKKTPLLVSEEAILECIRKLDASEFIGFHREILVCYLPFSMAKDFLKEVDESSWEQKTTVEEVLEEAKAYAEFGWKKILDHRGLSTSRTIAKMRAWMFLLSDPEMFDLCNDDTYMPYGAPILYQICKKYGWPVPENHEETQGGGTVGNMIKGLPCDPECSSCSS